MERNVERRKRLFLRGCFNHELSDLPILTIEDDRKRIRFRGRTVAPNSMESSSGLVSDRVPRLQRAHRSTARISVACKLHFITCYPRAALPRVYRPDLRRFSTRALSRPHLATPVDRFYTVSGRLSFGPLFNFANIENRFINATD